MIIIIKTQLIGLFTMNMFVFKYTHTRIYMPMCTYVCVCAHTQNQKYSINDKKNKDKPAFEAFLRFRFVLRWRTGCSLWFTCSTRLSSTLSPSFSVALLSIACPSLPLSDPLPSSVPSPSQALALYFCPCHPIALPHSARLLTALRSISIHSFLPSALCTNENSLHGSPEEIFN